MMDAAPKLPTYQSLAQVRAAKILSVERHGGMIRLTLDIPEQPGAYVDVSERWQILNLAAPGGYFCDYGDELTAYKAAEIFEERFALLLDPRPISAAELADIETMAGAQWNSDELARLASMRVHPLIFNATKIRLTRADGVVFEVPPEGTEA